MRKLKIKDIIVIIMIILLLLLMRRNYKNAVEKCASSGNSVEYCEKGLRWYVKRNKNYYTRQIRSSRIWR